MLKIEITNKVAILERIGKKSTLPILQNILIQQKGSQVLLSVTNLDIDATFNFPVNIGTTGPILVNAKNLKAVLKSITEKEISLQAKEGFLFLNDVCLPIEETPTSEFPKIQSQIKTEDAQTFNADKRFFEAMKFCQGFMSKDITGPGHNMFLSDGNIFATNGGILSVCSLDDTSLFKAIIPHQIVKILVVGMKDVGKMTITSNDKYIGFETKDSSFILRRIDEEFPLYNKVIGYKHIYSLNIDPHHFLNMVKSIPDPTRLKNVKAVKLSINKNTLTVKGKINQKEMPVESDSDDFYGYFNQDYLITTLTGFKDKIKISYTDNIRSLILTDGKLTRVIMPLRMS